MPAKDEVYFDLFSNQAANWVSDVINSRKYKHAIITIATTWSADATIKLWWDTKRAQLDFSSAASVANPIVNVWMTDVADIENWYVEWTTWIVLWWTDIIKSYNVEIVWLSHLALIIDSYTTWTINAQIMLANNQ